MSEATTLEEAAAEVAACEQRVARAQAAFDGAEDELGDAKGALRVARRQLNAIVRNEVETAKSDEI